MSSTNPEFNRSDTPSFGGLILNGNLTAVNHRPAVDLYTPTCGVRAGTTGLGFTANSNGVLLGAITPTAVGSCMKALTGGTVFTDLTTAANNATTADVTFGLAAQEDALYIGHLTQTFTGVKVKYTTAGSYSATTLWEYWNGTAWTNLATANLLVDTSASSGAFKAVAGTYMVSFNPPTDWATTTVNAVTGYFVRVRVSAFTSVATAPALDQIFVYPVNAGIGKSVFVSGHITAIEFIASTASASNADSKFLILNGTSGASYLFTATKAVAIVKDITINLAVAAGDQLVIQQLQQDGSTEFGTVNWRFGITTP